MRLKLKSNTIFKMACCPSKMVNCGIVQVGFPMETAIFQIKTNRNFSYNTRLLSFKVKPKVDRIFAVSYFRDHVQLIHKLLILSRWNFVDPNKSIFGLQFSVQRRIQIEQKTVHFNPASHALGHHPSIDRHTVIQIGGQHAIVFGRDPPHPFMHSQHATNTVCQ